MSRISAHAQAGPLAGRKAVAYYRASSAKQDKSVADQRREVRAWAAREGITIVGEFEDDGRSAFKYGREGRHGFRDMLDAVAQLDAELVIVWSLDRFSRQFDDGMIEILQLRKAGVLLADTEVGLYQLDNVGGAVMATARQFAAEEFSRKLGHNVRRGQARERAAGAWHGVAPFGYRRERDAEGHCVLVPEPVEAEVVVRIFETADQGKAAHAIASSLNRDGLRTRKGMTWTGNAVKSILRGTSYAGFRTTKRGPGNTPREWEPARITTFLNRDLWGRVFDQWKALRAAPQARGRKRAFSGLVFCADCGDRCYTYSRGHTEPRATYICRTKLFSGDCRTTGWARIQDLEDAVLAYWRNVATGGDLEGLARAVTEQAGERLRAEQATSKPLRDELVELDRQEASLIELRLAGAETDLVVAKLREIQARRDHVRAMLGGNEAEVATLPVEHVVAHIRRAIEGVASAHELRQFVDRIEVTGPREIRLSAFGIDVDLTLPDRTKKS